MFEQGRQALAEIDLCVRGWKPSMIVKLATYKDIEKYIGNNGSCWKRMYKCGKHESWNELCSVELKLEVLV